MRAIYYLVVLVPAAIALDALDAPASAVFAVSALAVVPGAALMGEATEQLAERSGPGVAGLLNVTLGNAPELIIALFALGDGLQEVVKASLVGSVIGNALLVLGASLLAGGWRRRRQRYNVRAARALAGTLLLGTTALLLPSILRLAQSGGLPRVGAGRGAFGAAVETASIVVSVALIAVYARGLISSLRLHREGFEPPAAAPRWSAPFAALVLVAAAALVAATSDTLVKSVAQASREVGLSQFFIGAIVVAIVGNAAEHYVAVVAALRDRVDLTLSIAVGSAAQVGLLLAPVVALLSLLIGPARMPLVFNGYELAGLIAAGWLVVAATFDGTSTRLRGAGLLCAYLALGVAFALA